MKPLSLVLMLMQRFTSEQHKSKSLCFFTCLVFHLDFFRFRRKRNLFKKVSSSVLSPTSCFLRISRLCNFFLVEPFRVCKKNSGLSFKSGMSNVNNSINIIWLRKRAWLHLKTIYLILWDVDDLQRHDEVCFKKCCNFSSYKYLHNKLN